MPRLWSFQELLIFTQIMVYFLIASANMTWWIIGNWNHQGSKSVMYSNQSFFLVEFWSSYKESFPLSIGVFWVPHSLQSMSVSSVLGLKRNNNSNQFSIWVWVWFKAVKHIHRVIKTVPTVLAMRKVRQTQRTCRSGQVLVLLAKFFCYLNVLTDQSPIVLGRARSR